MDEKEKQDADPGAGAEALGTEELAHARGGRTLRAARTGSSTGATAKLQVHGYLAQRW